MWNSQRLTAIIPARSGSRRLPGKNLRGFAGKPLISWSIQLSLELACIDECIVTSDDEEVLRLAREYQVTPLRRPAALASDSADSMDVIWHALDCAEKKPGIVLLLQPTSPLRLSSDITGALDRFSSYGAPSVVTVSKFIKHPEWTYLIGRDHRLSPVSHDEDGKIRVGINGAVYAAGTEWLRRSGSFLSDGAIGYLMPDERSIDIDVLAEFEEAERLFKPVQPRRSR